MAVRSQLCEFAFYQFKHNFVQSRNEKQQRQKHLHDQLPPGICWDSLLQWAGGTVLGKAHPESSKISKICSTTEKATSNPPAAAQNHFRNPKTPGWFGLGGLKPISSQSHGKGQLQCSAMNPPEPLFHIKV